MLLVAPLSHKHVRLEIIVDLYFLPPWRLTVTIGGGYLVPLYKLNLLSNFGSYSMASSNWFILLMLLVTTLYNLLISLHSEAFILSYHSMSLEKEQSESLLEILILDDSCFFWCLGASINGLLQFMTWTGVLGYAKENFSYFLSYFISLFCSWREPECLVMLKRILFYFLSYFISLFCFFSYLWQFLEALYLLNRLPHRPPLMYSWSYLYPN